MSDYLRADELSETLADLIAGWNGGDPITYVQRSRLGKLDIVGNGAAASLLGHALQRGVPGAALADWLSELDQAGMATCYVAGQNLFRAAVEACCQHKLELDIIRTARHGDCRGTSNFGTASEQAYTKAILAASPLLPRRGALVKVLGTNMLFMQSSFPFDESNIFSPDFKVTRYFSEFRDICIPLLVAKKELQQILIAESDVLNLITSSPTLREYRSIFHEVANVDTGIEQDRAACQQAISQYQSWRKTSPGLSAPVLSWLDAARLRWGLNRGNLRTTTKKSNGAASILKIYLNVEAEQNADRLLALRQAISDAEVKPENHLLHVAMLIANCRLGLPVDSNALDMVLAADGEHEIWWNTAATALTIAALTAGSETKWVARFGQRGKSIYEQLACESESNYNRLRCALLDCYPVWAKELFPFQRFDDYVLHAVTWRNLLEALENGAQLRPSSSNTGEYEVLQHTVLGYFTRDNFFRSFALLIDKLPENELLEKLKQSEQIWERDPNSYYHALCRVYIENNKLDQAHAAVYAWIAAAPEDENAWSTSGLIFHLQDNLPLALTSHQRACSMNPKNHLAAFQLATTLWSMDRDNDAIAVLNDLRAVDSKARNSILLAKIYYFQNRYLEADNLLSSISIEDHDSRSCYYAIMACARTRGWTAAKAMMASCTNQLDEATLAELTEDISEFLTAQGANQEAADCFLPRLLFQEGWSDAIAEVAKAVYKSGQPNEAVVLWKRAEALPDSTLAYTLHAMALMYGEGLTPDLCASHRVAIEGLKKNRDSVGLLGLAGQSASATGNDPLPYFRQLVAVVEALSIDQRTLYRRAWYALAKYNLGNIECALAELEPLQLSGNSDYALWSSLLCVLCAFSQGVQPSPQLYAKARQHFDDASPVEQETNMRHHMLDIQSYGQRGMFMEWEYLRTSAQQYFQLWQGQGPCHN